MEEAFCLHLIIAGVKLCHDSNVNFLAGLIICRPMDGFTLLQANSMQMLSLGLNYFMECDYDGTKKVHRKTCVWAVH